MLWPYSNCSKYTHTQEHKNIIAHSSVFIGEQATTQRKLWINCVTLVRMSWYDKCCSCVTPLFETKKRGRHREEEIKEKSQDCDVAALAIRTVFPSFSMYTVPFTLY